MNKTDLSKYDNSFYDPMGGILKRTIWYFTNHLVFNHALLPLNTVKLVILRLFGARVGQGVHIKPSVNIKYPWLLEIGDFVWIGEKVWIDNLTLVKIGNNVTLSQGAMLLTGNHDFTLPTFDLKVANIELEDGVWLGARSVVCPGITCGSHSILTVNSLANKNMEPYGIYQGNPAVKVKERSIKS